LSLCSRIVVLHHGELIAEGAPQAIIEDPRVIQAYLGKRYAKAKAGADG
jgi:branched-chain amino acid transport system ATP-binding protein